MPKVIFQTVKRQVVLFTSSVLTMATLSALVDELISCMYYVNSHLNWNDDVDEICQQ